MHIYNKGENEYKNFSYIMSIKVDVSVSVCLSVVNHKQLVDWPSTSDQ